MKYLLVIAACFVACSLALMHEDEAGKRDWYWSGVGRVDNAVIISTPSLKQVVVTSAEGTVAALSTLHQGAIRWRHLLGEPQVCISSTDSSVVVMSQAGVGHVFLPTSGALVTSFRLELATGAKVKGCFIDSADHSIRTVSTQGSTAVIHKFQVDDFDAHSAPIPQYKSFTVSAPITNVKIGGQNVWIERNGTGVDVIELKGDEITTTDTKGRLDAASPAGDVLMSFFKDDSSEDAGRMLRIMTANNKVVKASERKGSSCKDCRVSLATFEDSDKKGRSAPSTGDVVVTIRERKDQFSLFVGAMKFDVLYSGSWAPRVISARQTAKKADVLLRACNGHLFFVTASFDDKTASVAWERFEGLSQAALTKLVPLPALSLAGKKNTEDLFGFNVHALIVSKQGVLYRVPVENKGEKQFVVANIAEALQKALGVDCVCGALYKDLSVDDNGVATVSAVYKGSAVNVKVEISTGIITEVSQPVKEPLFVSTSKLIAASKAVEVGKAAEEQYVYTIDSEKGRLQGFYIPKNSQTSQATWEINFGGALAAVATPSDRLQVLTVENLRIFPNTTRGEKVNEVRRKYPTQNIIAVAHLLAEEDRLVVSIIDSISGSILATVSHANVQGKVTMIIVEHVVLYHFLNAERMRFSLGVLELMEHEEVIVSDSTPTSPAQVIASFFQSQKSFDSMTARPPLVASMVLAFPGGELGAMGATTSYQGIARKHVIFAMQDGHVHAVDLRSLCFGGQSNPQKPEEVFLHVVLPSVNIISHKHSVLLPQQVTSTPTELESSAHVLVSGLDLFYSRVSAGKAFDLLNDDFNHNLLMVVCGAMGVLSLVARYFVARKSLRLVWA